MNSYGPFLELGNAEKAGLDNSLSKPFREPHLAAHLAPSHNHGVIGLLIILSTADSLYLSFMDIRFIGLNFVTLQCTCWSSSHWFTLTAPWHLSLMTSEEPCIAFSVGPAVQQYPYAL